MGAAHRKIKNRGSFVFSFLLIFLTITASTTQSNRVDPIQTHLLMPGSGLQISRPVNCDSWRFGVETNNIRDWSVVPEACANYVGNYMESSQYESDCDAVVSEAIKYVDGLQSIADNDIWVFDIDETALSNLEYYERDDVAYGSQKFNREELNKWIKSGNAKALKPVQRLYNYLIAKKVKIVFLTGVSDQFEEARQKNLQDQGYNTMEMLILKKKEDKDLHGSDFKSAKRRELETTYKYNIIGNIGDQWSDVIGTNVGKRTFKLPNPMYYI